MSLARLGVRRTALERAPARKFDRWERLIIGRIERGELRSASAFELVDRDVYAFTFERGSWSPRRFARFLGLFARAWGVGS